MLTTLAATQNQLYAQMLRDGFSRDAIAKVDDTYQTVAKLCFRFYRGNGKPIVSHFASVASAVAWDTKDVLLIQAALGHTVLINSKVPPLIRLRGRKAAAQFRASKLGADLTEWLTVYQREGLSVSFDPDTYADRQLSENQRKLLHLKLADMLDHLNDEFGPQVTGKTLVADLDNHQLAADCAQLASMVGARMLAAGFETLAQMPYPTDPILAPHERSYDMKRVLKEWR